jgi:hypothetical protein
VKSAVVRELVPHVSNTLRRLEQPMPGVPDWTGNPTVGNNIAGVLKLGGWLPRRYSSRNRRGPPRRRKLHEIGVLNSVAGSGDVDAAPSCEATALLEA